MGMKAKAISALDAVRDRLEEDLGFTEPLRELASFTEAYRPSKKKAKAAWMKKFDDEVKRLNPDAKQRQDYWDTATHLWFQGEDPKKAAKRVAGLKKEALEPREATRARLRAIAQRTQAAEKGKKVEPREASRERFRAIAKRTGATEPKRKLKPGEKMVFGKVVKSSTDLDTGKVLDEIRRHLEEKEGKVPSAEELIRLAGKKTKIPEVKATLKQSKELAKTAHEFVTKYRDTFLQHGDKARDQAVDYLLRLALETHARSRKGKKRKFGEAKGGAQSYIKRIKNAKKKAYAQAYWKWLQGGKKGREPDEGDLSYMAAQGVRLQLGDMQEANGAEQVACAVSGALGLKKGEKGDKKKLAKEIAKRTKSKKLARAAMKKAQEF
jgi:hypothetical protein